MINVALWLKKEWTDVPACPDTRGNTEKRAREMITADILIDMVGLVCEYDFKRKSREVKLEPQGQEKEKRKGKGGKFSPPVEGNVGGGAPSCGHQILYGQETIGLNLENKRQVA